MLTIFNRAELLLTRDPARFHQAAACLKNAGISYFVKQSDPTSLHPMDRAVVGSLGVTSSVEYRIYVNKNRLEEARHLICRDQG